MEKENNLAWKFVIILCILFFGVFLYAYLLQNRKLNAQLAMESNDSDGKNLSNDWKNIFGDFQNAFSKMIK